MANGLNSIVKRRGGDGGSNNGGDATKMGSRRIFTPHFKLQVLDSYRQDADCKGNQRATARKYGIHRRQIQKWLQAENSLRGSVQQHHHSSALTRGKREDVGGEVYDVRRAATLDCGRQGGAVGSSAISRDCWTMRTDCTTISPPLLPVPAAVDFMNDRLCVAASSPMDLSVKKFPISDATTIDVSSILVRPEEAIAVSERLCHGDVNTQSGGEILDLTCRKRKFCDMSEVSSSTEAVPVAIPRERAEAPPPAKDVKLFKPYLLCDDDDKDRDHKMAAVAFPKTAAVVTAAVDLFPGKYDAWHMNNNILTNSIIYPMDCYGYNYQYYPSSQHEQQIRYSPCYDSASSFSPSSCCDDDYPSLSPDYDAMSVRQRQSYSVDFKLSAIDSYYHDLECRGNQRAVASKFCIHRRQIQKWLKQEDILRQRLQTSPPLT